MPQDIFDRIAVKVPKPQAATTARPAPVTPAQPATVDIFDRVAPAAPISAAQRGRAPIEYTAGEVGDAQARELILGGAERLGVDLQNPVTGTVKNWVGGLKSLATEGGGALRDMVTGQGTARGQQMVQGVASGLAQPYSDMYGGLKEGDSDRFARGVGGAVTDLAGAVLATPKGRSVASTAIEQVGGLPVRATKAAVEKGVSLATGVPLKAEIAITKAIKPRASQVGFERSMGMALPEVKAAEAKLGRPIGGLDDLLEATKLAKQDLRARFDSIKGPQAQRGITLDRVADAMEGAVSLKTRMESPGKITSIKNRADAYRRAATIDEIEDLLQTTNAELEAYYDKYPAAQRSAAAKNPETAVLTAQARKLREVLYSAMDVPGGGQAAKELNRRYGALLDLEQETTRRRNVYMRQQPESITEQMSKVGAAFKVGKGVIRGTVGLDPAGGLMDIGSAVAGRKMAAIIKERNSADYLIKNAFERYSGAPVPIQMPAPFKPKGLLGTGNIQLPAPDTSGVTGTLAQLAPGTRETRTGRLLEAGLPLPPPTELPSGGFQMDVTTGPPRGRAIPYSQRPAPPVPSKPGEGATVVRGVEKTGEVPRVMGDEKPVTTGPAKGMILNSIDTSEISGQTIYRYRDPMTGDELPMYTRQK